MSGNIFLFQGDGDLVKLEQRPYDSEALLQQLLAEHPDLLAGDQMDADEPRRWLLVSREMGVPDEEDGSDRWSLDHLFLDQDGVPTLVEVKRSSDSRIRRKVVGQMLDYAANAVVYWPLEQIQAKFDATCQQKGVDPEDELAAHLGVEEAADFWQRVKTNLQAGRIRMVFVADEIPPQLRRIVEFLNQQMDPAEVLAVEVKQFLGQGVKTLVPRVIGQTQAAQVKKSSGTSKREPISEADYLTAMKERRGVEETEVTKKIIQWANQLGLRATFTQGNTLASFIPVVLQNGTPLYPISVRTGGGIRLQMRWLRDKLPFSDDGKRGELIAKINSIPGVSIPADRFSGMPRIGLGLLTNQEALQQFLAVMTWMVKELQTPGGG